MGEADVVRLVRPGDRSEGAATPGMRREQALSTGKLWSGIVTTDAGMVTGWHHHGDHETSIYVISGAMRMESGPGGGHVVEAEPGDFIHVPAQAIHREGNPSDQSATAVVVRAGSGEPVTNVDGPAPD